MERRTFLKGILGAAAAAFHPALIENAVGASADTVERKDPATLITCVRDGYYLIQTQVEVIHRNPVSCYSLTILRNGERCGIGQFTMSGKPDTSFKSAFSIMMPCKAGDQFSLKLTENGMDRTTDLQSALFAIQEARLPRNGSLQPVFMITTVGYRDEGSPIPIHIE